MTFASLVPASYTSDLKVGYELGYGIAISIYDTSAQRYKGNCMVSSALGQRRGTTVEFQATLAGLTAQELSAVSTSASSLTVANFATATVIAQQQLGSLFTAPLASSMIMGTPAPTPAPAPPSDDTQGYILVGSIVGVIALVSVYIVWAADVTGLTFWHKIRPFLALIDFATDLFFLVRLYHTSPTLFMVAIVALGVSMTLNGAAFVAAITVKSIGSDNLDTELITNNVATYALLVVIACTRPDVFIFLPWKDRRYQGLPNAAVLGLINFGLFEDVVQIIVAAVELSNSVDPFAIASMFMSAGFVLETLFERCIVGLFLEKTKGIAEKDQRVTVGRALRALLSPNFDTENAEQTAPDVVEQTASDGSPEEVHVAVMPTEIRSEQKAPFRGCLTNNPPPQNSVV
jgi:hypothetical protein